VNDMNVRAGGRTVLRGRTWHPCPSEARERGPRWRAGWYTRRARCYYRSRFADPNSTRR
jgi:hypothetical protein